jgi:hypothetical protein
MANVKISDLTAAAAAAGANEYEINEAGTSKKVTGTQISAFVKADLLDDTTVNFTGTLQNGGSNVVVDSDIGSTVQGYDADLSAIGGLAKTDGNFIVGNGSTWVAESGATARTSLGLGSLATLSTVDAATITDNSVGAAELNVPGTGTAGQYLASDGDGTMTWTTLAAGGGFSNMDVITSTGTWTNPGSVTKVKVTVIGGGGGAGGSHPASNYRHSGGGGGGGTAIEVATIPTSPVPVTVGSGGAGGPSGSNGSTGGTSSFGAYCSATGGAGSVTASPGPDYRVFYGGAGGAGSGGNLNMNGGNGGPEGLESVSSGAPDILANFTNGWGGTTYLSAGSLVRRGQNLNIAGVPGLNYGGGGGGCGNRAAGGPGAAGVVIVEY